MSKAEAMLWRSAVITISSFNLGTSSSGKKYFAGHVISRHAAFADWKPMSSPGSGVLLPLSLASALLLS